MLFSSAMVDEAVEVDNGISSTILEKMASKQPLILSVLCKEMNIYSHLKMGI